ncbi:MAG: 5-(carboxyamino)imidazole ribonucleotide synthase [Candidatus Muiribacteriota bacterium]
MDSLVSTNFKLGIISGGQLGKMLIHEASKWDIITYVMDNDINCPAGKIASKFIKGSNIDFDSVYNFGKQVDILTFEMENVNIEALKKLKSEGLRIAPSPEILELIQDKGLQKCFFEKNNIPTSPFKLFDSEKTILEGIKNKEIKFPFVQKIRKGGYDGRGVAVINDENDLDKLLSGPSLIEEKVEIKKEIAVIAARNGDGEIKCYPVVEMLFDSNANIVDKIICPSSIPQNQSDKAVEIASKLIKLLDLEGLLACEFFIDSNHNIVVNEVAPRTHNSGHHTIDSVVTSQFEQHLRAILNLPLGSTALKLPSVMINILGETGYEGAVVYEGLKESLAVEGVKIHLYGKKITKPYRKMGHVTILSSSIENALKNADKVKKLIKVKS